MRNFPVRLPSLDLVRGFVAVGRRMSMTLAAAGSVPHPVGGQPPNPRARRGARGEAARPRLSLDQLHRRGRALLSRRRQRRSAAFRWRRTRSLPAASRQPVTITATIGVTGLWIMPRLGAFHERHPEIDVRVAANNKLVDLRTRSADIAIRYCDAASAPPGRAACSAKRSRLSFIPRSASPGSTPLRWRSWF